MTTKGIMGEAKADIAAWLAKAVCLHESLPSLCADNAPELVGESPPGSSLTCASSAFLMSLTALLLRLGSWRFASIEDKVRSMVFV